MKLEDIEKGLALFETDFGKMLMKRFDEMFKEDCKKLNEDKEKESKDKNLNNVFVEE